MSGVPDGWTACSLSELVSYVTSGSRDWSKYYADNGALFVRTQDINKNRLADLSSVARVRLPEKVEGKRTLILAGDVLVTITGANVGRCAVISKALPEAYVSQSVALVRPVDSALAPYLQRQLIAPDPALGKTWLEQSAYGLGRPVLSLDDVREAPIQLAPLAEQRRIVAKLDALTAHTARARTDLDRIPALAVRFKQAVLAKAFSGELTAAWRAKNGVVEATWPRIDVGSLTTDIRYGTATKCAFSPSETPVLRIPNIAKGRIDTTDLKHASFDEKERAKLALKAGDVLVIRSNGSLTLVGRAAVATDEVAGFLYAGYLIRLRLNMERVSPEFLQLAFEEPSIRAVIEGFAKSTSGVNNINSEQLKSLMVPLPSLVEQTEIVRRVEAAFAEIDRLTAEAAAARRLLDRLDQAILVKAFRGELVPQDPADEPASVLLERIRAERAPAPKPSRRRRKAAA